MRELDVADPESKIERRARPALVDFNGALLDLVDGGDRQAAVFGQNVILETMEYTVFLLHVPMRTRSNATCWPAWTLTAATPGSVGCVDATLAWSML